MLRHPNALVVSLCAALATLLLSSVDATRASAEPNARASALARVQKIVSRRETLGMQLERLKTQYAKKRAAAASLKARLEAPQYSLASAPQERAKLLDQTAESLRAAAAVAGRMAANAREDLALEAELGEIVASAQREVAAAASDQGARGRSATQRARLHLKSLRTRGKVAPPRAIEARHARVAELAERWSAQQEEAEQLAHRYSTELRFASVEQTASPGKAGEMPADLSVRACRVRSVDWRNVTITVAGESMRLLDGQGTLTAEGGARGGRVTLKQVDYADSNLDTREEALVLVEREERGGRAASRKADVLYVYESALDCSLRRRSEVVLSAEPGGSGKPVRGGYEYVAPGGEVRSYRWDGGFLRDQSAEAELEQAAR